MNCNLGGLAPLHEAQWAWLVLTRPAGCDMACRTCGAQGLILVMPMNERCRFWRLWTHWLLPQQHRCNSCSSNWCCMIDDSRSYCRLSGHC